MSNEKGFTLIELLGGLLLFSIVTVAAVSLVVQSMHNSANAEATNSLRNDATYVTQVLRTAYENGTLDGMCIEEDEKNNIYALKSTENEIVLDLTEKNMLKNPRFSYEGADKNKPNCFYSQSDKQTLQVNFTISNEKSEPFVVDTAFSKPSESDLTVSLSNPDNESPVIQTCEILEGDLMNRSKEVTSNLRMYVGDTTIPEWQFNNHNYDYGLKVSNGSLLVTHSTSIHNILFEVDHDFKVNGTLNLEETVDTNVGKHTYIQEGLTIKRIASLETAGLSVNQQLQVQEDAILMVHENLEAKSAHFLSNSLSCVSGDTNINGNTKYQESTSFLSGGDLKVLNLDIIGNSKVSIDKNAIISGNMHYQEQSKFEVGGDITVNGNVTSYGGYTHAHGNITILGDVAIPKGAVLAADGDIHIKGKISPDWGGGTICAKGDIEMDQPYTGHELQILPNNQKCQK